MVSAFGRKYPGPKHNVFYKEPIGRWDEGIPLGNGRAGCLVWGDGAPLRFSLDRSDLWDERPSPETLAADFTYDELIRLAKSGNHDGIAGRFENFLLKNPTPSKIPAGRILLDFGKPCAGFRGELNLLEATAEITLAFGRKRSTVRAYMHATRGCGRITVEGGADPPRIILAPPAFGASGQTENGQPSRMGLELLGYPDAIRYEDGHFMWYRQRTRSELEYALALAWQNDGADKLDVFFVSAASSDGGDWLENAKEQLRRCLRESDALSESHKAWWRGYWGRSSVDLPDSQFEKHWYLSNYLFGSCARADSPAIPLQGLWTADDGYLPPWKGEYANNLNTQMTYWHYMKANHLEEGAGLAGFLWKLVPEARRFASSFYRTPGICLPTSMSLSGKPMGGWSMYALSPANQIWLCQAFEHYWRYSGDADFLRERAYPYFKMTEECLSALLRPSADGKLELPVSSSPEIHDNRPDAWLTPNSNFDLSLLLYLYRTLGLMAEELGDGERERWNDRLSALSALHVNGNRVLMLSPDESLGESHRHFSHMAAVYPLRLLDMTPGSADREIADASIHDLEFRGTGRWIGFSYVWIAAMYALQGNGNAAWWQLHEFFETGCSPNGFCLNYDWMGYGATSWHLRCFTLETNMGAADAIQEMLLQTQDHVIRVFHAVPDRWKDGRIRFERFLGWNGVEISAEMNRGKLGYIHLSARNAGRFRIANGFGTDRIARRGEGGRETIVCPENGVIGLDLRAGEECLLLPVRTKGTPAGFSRS